MTKRRLYAEHNVQHYWLIDPDARTLEAFSLEAGRWMDAESFDETAVARVPPFDSIELPIGRLFPVAQTLEVYALGERGHWREVHTFQGDEKVRVPPFDDVEIDLVELCGTPNNG